jgi:hypothetical protein
VKTAFESECLSCRALSWRVLGPVSLGNKHREKYVALTRVSRSEDTLIHATDHERSCSRICESQTGKEKNIDSTRTSASNLVSQIATA